MVPSLVLKFHPADHELSSFFFPYAEVERKNEKRDISDRYLG